MQTIGTPHTTSTTAEEFRRRQRASTDALRTAMRATQTPQSDPVPTEPAANLLPTQTLQEHGLIPQDCTGSVFRSRNAVAQRRRSPLPGSVEDFAVRIADTGPNGKQAVVIALRGALSVPIPDRIANNSPEHPDTPANELFDTTGSEWTAQVRHWRALWFVRFLAHAPTFTGLLGNGDAFIDCLAVVAGADGVATVMRQLGCDDSDLERAARKARSVAGERLLETAAARALQLDLPAWVTKKVEPFPVLRSVVRLLAALCIETRSREVFLSIDDAASVLRLNRDSVADAMRAAVRRGVVAITAKGTRRKPGVAGVATRYRVEWALPVELESTRRGG